MTTSTNKPPTLLLRLNKLQNPFMKWLLRSPLHPVVSHMFLLITFTGRKSGQVYTTPVQYRQEGSTVYLITSEGYTWWKNLRGGADVQVHLRGTTYAGYAEAASDGQTVNAITQIVYPSLNAERRARFVPGKVAISIALKPASAV